MQQKKLHLLTFGIGGVFLFLDQTIKYFFSHHQDFSFYLVKPWLGLEYFENPGVAFGIPVPGWMVLVYTPFVLLVILLFLGKQHSFKKTFALYLILFGAISNFIDRIFLNFTVDYIRIITSILNIADIMIVAGALILVWAEMKKK